VKPWWNLSETLVEGSEKTEPFGSPRRSAAAQDGSAPRTKESLKANLPETFTTEDPKAIAA